MPTGPNDPDTAYPAAAAVSTAQGVVTLEDGEAEVPATAVTANSRIFLSVQSLGTVTVASALTVTGRSYGASFGIAASQATDTSEVAWHIIEPPEDEEEPPLEG